MSKVFHNVEDQAIVTLLQHGAIGILPTDTVYGLVCAAGNQAAVARLYNVKYRESKPGTIIAASVAQLVALGLQARYLKAVEQYWPNPISVIIPCGDGLTYLHRGMGSLAVRVPADATMRAVLAATGPLLTTSANQPDELTAEDYDSAYRYFGEQVDFYVDLGSYGRRPPSTIIRMIDDVVEVIREGAVVIDSAGRVVHVKN